MSRERYAGRALASTRGAPAASQIAVPSDAVAAARDTCERYQGGVRAGGGIPAVAEKLGMSAAVLYNKLAGDEDSYHKLSVSDFIRIFLVTGDIKPLQTLARVMDCAVFPVPDLTTISDEALLDIVCKMQQAAGEWHNLLRLALADGQIDPQERAELRREAYEWIGAIAEAEARIEGLVRG